MANSRKRCKFCRHYFPADDMVILPAGTFCSKDHAGEWVIREQKRKKNERKQWQEDFKKRTATKKGRDEIKRKRTDYEDILQELINQWIIHVRDYGKPCCTCGAPYGSMKFDAGHYRSRGAAKELRFELTNIHGQCFQCNTHGSGMRVEYQAFIVAKYGKAHLDWLDGPHPKLKEKFPDIESLRQEASRWRKLLKEAGLTPRK